MLRHLLMRLLGIVPTLLLMATLAFAILHAAPGGPFDREKQLLPEIRQAIEAQYHLDEPLWRQYLRYLDNLLHGDLGPSYQYRGTRVGELIAAGLPVDAAVGGSALLLALLAGGALGTLAALRRGSPWERLLMGVAVLGLSVPPFVVAPLLILLFAVWLRWLPPGDWGGLTHLVLPAVALALPYGAHIARLLRASLLEVLASPFIRTARAQGLPMRTVLWRHALKPALLPVASYLGPTCAGLLTGSIIIESVFGLPGIGRYFTYGALNRDYTLVMGVTLLYGLAIVLCNLAVDLCYAWLDPRLRQGR